ncbi:MAG: YtxH domain-containing protein [Anaerolineae bacterium]|nr:YtxH domain-containing protein [Anaerolineae bacterium]
MRKFLMFISGLVTGIGFGVGTATLIAPMSGQELMDEAQRRLDALREEARKAAEARKVELETQLADITAGTVVFEQQETKTPTASSTI